MVRDNIWIFLFSFHITEGFKGFLILLESDFIRQFNRVYLLKRKFSISFLCYIEFVKKKKTAFRDSRLILAIVLVDNYFYFGVLNNAIISSPKTDIFIFSIISLSIFSVIRGNFLSRQIIFFQRTSFSEMIQK